MVSKLSLWVDGKTQTGKNPFRNATIWTNETEGILTTADIAISNGKIIAVGEALLDQEIFDKNPFKEIDASGKHITSGIIDEHSHIAIERGVNEGHKPAVLK